jgi:hypothetical protein
MSDAERIADRNYQPTDDDVIRARLRTLGVQEYRFIFDHGKQDPFLSESFANSNFTANRTNNGSRMEAIRCRGYKEQCESCYVKLSQVGNVGAQRAAWYPYFDDGVFSSLLLLAAILSIARSRRHHILGVSFSYHI